MIPNEIKEFVNEITSKAFANGKFSVNITFSGADISVHFYPIPKDAEQPKDEPEKVDVYDD